jgi:TRAP transporter TAXI family solute receptor
MELFDVGPMIALSSIIASGAIVILAVFLFIHSAPPTTLTITSGPEGSVFQKNALKYAKILEKNGVKLKVLTSNGSLENLARLEDPKSHVDVGIVQGGITGPSGSSTDNLISLGGISYQPLLVFYRGKPLELLSELEGKKIAIGPQGSGTRNFALTILAANGIKEGGTTQLLDLEAEQASKELLNRTIDAAFIMSESASTDILHNLMHSDEVRLLSFKQANAYSRKIDYLSMLELPEGAIDFGKDLPAHDVSLVGPMVELVAVKGLHPALSDLLLEAAVEVHNRPGVFQKRGDFPVPVEHAIHLSDDAVRFYKSGKSFLYRYLPFWIASLSNRILVVFVPTLLILIPALRSIPGFFRWKFQSKIHRRYRDLLSLEHKILLQSKPVAGEDLKAEFDHIESAVNKMKIPAAFADQFYGLRGHIDYVRGLVERRQS